MCHQVQANPHFSSLTTALTSRQVLTALTGQKGRKELSWGRKETHLSCSPQHTVVSCISSLDSPLAIREKQFPRHAVLPNSIRLRYCALKLLNFYHWQILCFYNCAAISSHTLAGLLPYSLGACLSILALQWLKAQNTTPKALLSP